MRANSRFITAVFFILIPFLKNAPTAERRLIIKKLVHRSQLDAENPQSPFQPSVGKLAYQDVLFRKENLLRLYKSDLNQKFWQN